MKNIFSLLMILFFSTQSFAQIVMADTVVYDPLPKNNNPYLLKDTIINNTASPITIIWSKSADTLLNGVNCAAICDPTVCYAWGGPVVGGSFMIPAWSGGAIYTDVRATPGAVDGDSYITVSTNYGDMVFKYTTVPGIPASCNADFFLYEDTLAAPHTYIGINTCIGNALTYDWNWGDGTPNSSGPFPTHTYAAAGVYNICVAISDTLGCTDTFCSNENINKTLSSWYTVTFSAPTSMSDQRIKKSMIYPNPVRNALYIAGESTRQYKVDIFSLPGAKVHTGSVKGNEALDVSALPAGIYLLKISNSMDEFQYIKLRKE